MSEETKAAEEAAAVEAPAAPHLKIVTPSTTPEEVAAIVAVFAAMGGGAPAPEPARSEWAAPKRLMRPGLGHQHGRGAWRASGLPS